MAVSMRYWALATGLCRAGKGAHHRAHPTRPRCARR
jgi:hypothetical protein